ncbi:hypothetical protein [Streptomyces minutiscleroticus]|uniref:hypothetical protein n=1 Tax=Streptomyces minutiscleroticus TaxID=68238 RepID=UPI00167D05C6|nr:hypothetical protein [Streptomyces minutiscleroticus]
MSRPLTVQRTDPPALPPAPGLISQLVVTTGHRRTDRSVTRNSAAIRAVSAPASHHLAASSRTASRSPCSAGVSPPPCAYRIKPSYRRDHHSSRPPGHR